MAVKIIRVSSSSSSSSTISKKPNRNAVIKRRNAFKKMVKKQSTKVSASLESSHGVSWVRVYLLGKGSFGSVFLAKRRTAINQYQETNFPLHMAVKSATLDQSFSLKYEKQILSNLTTSTHVVHCYGDEITEMGNGVKIYNLLLEFCSRLSLDNQIRLSGGGLPESDVQNYARDILQGLNYIHSRGYVHCVFKPCNILLVPGIGGRSGTFVAKIADFGLAKVVGEEEEDCSYLRGTYLYMSPELVRDKKLEYSADIWALGCVVLEMLTGKPAWDYSEINDLLWVIGGTNRVPEVPSGVSEDAKDFLTWCLDRNAARRLSADRLLEHPFVSVDDW